MGELLAYLLESIVDLASLRGDQRENCEVEDLVWKAEVIDDQAHGGNHEEDIEYFSALFNPKEEIRRAERKEELVDDQSKDALDHWEDSVDHPVFESSSKVLLVIYIVVDVDGVQNGINDSNEETVLGMGRECSYDGLKREYRKKLRIIGCSEGQLS